MIAVFMFLPLEILVPYEGSHINQNLFGSLYGRSLNCLRPKKFDSITQSTGSLQP